MKSEMKRFLLIFATLFVALSADAHAEEYITDIKQAMIKAIDAPPGTVKGRLGGPIGQYFAQQTRSTAPVMVEITPVKSFKQKGCKRLKVTISQAAVPTQDGQKVDLALDYELNLCRDGTPPSEGFDLGGLAEFFKNNPQLQNKED